jgi:hypothetical protein
MMMMGSYREEVGDVVCNLIPILQTAKGSHFVNTFSRNLR